MGNSNFYSTHACRAAMLFGIALLSISSVHGSEVTILVKDAAGKPSPKTVVYALRYGSHGPDGSASLVGTTNRKGKVSFKLDNANEYEVIADKHGLGPTARSQIFNLSRLHLVAGAKGTSEIKLGQPFENRGLIAVNTVHGTPNKFIIGTIRRKVDGAEIAFAGNTTNERGTTTLVFNNIPPADANAYQIDIFDPSAMSESKKYYGELEPVLRDERTSVFMDLKTTQSAWLSR